jgi:hypothetical protein
MQAARRHLFDACNTHLILRIFWVLLAVAYPLLHNAKNNLIPFRAETNGASNLLKKIKVFACASDMN